MQERSQLQGGAFGCWFCGDILMCECSLAVGGKQEKRTEDFWRSSEVYREGYRE